MVTEFHRQHLEEAGSLSDIFGMMTTLNVVVAILAGLFAQGIADFTGTQAAPFMTAIVLLVMAFSFISSRWVRKLRRSLTEIKTADHSVDRELWRQPSYLSRG